VPSLKLHLGARTLVARCDPSLHFEAESVLRLVGELESSGNVIADGARIPLGWSRLSVHTRGDDLVLCEPQFDGDPLADVRDDITQTLAVLVEQASFVQELGTASQPTQFDDELTVACGVLAEPRIYCERREAGWYIGPRDREGELDCVNLRVYELLELRPAVLRVLALPVGTLVAFDGDVIETVLDASDRDLLVAS
jgi:hypothetical protein